MLRKSGNPTLVDVAREAGVSLKTASRVLNSSPQLAPETEKHVRAVMARLGYQPNEMARGLKVSRSAAIGMVVPNLADPFTASSIKAVQDVARSHGHVVMLTSSGGDETLEREEVETLVRRQVDGLILVPADGRKNTLQSIIPARVPVVTFDQPIRDSSWDCILVTNRDSAREATEHLIGHGYKNILAVGARPHLYTCAERIAGYREAIAKKRLKEFTLLVEHESELTAEVVAKALNGPRPIQAIFTLNWVTTMLVLRALRDLKKKIAKDVAFISFDDFDLAEIMTPGLTVVRQPSSELGRQSAELLFQRIGSSPGKRRKTITLPTAFDLRASCGCKE